MRTEPTERSRRRAEARDRLVSWLVLATAIAALGTVAVHLGTDSNGDLRNYHYYSGWALTNKPVGFDIAPAQLQSYLHPLLDAIFYRVLRWLNAYPLLFTFVWSIPQAVAVWMVYRVARLAFDILPRGGTALAVMAALIGGSGAAGMAVIGTSMSEAIPDVAIFGAIWLILLADRAGRAGGPMAWRYGLAGALAATAAVLKLTTAPYLIGIVAATLAMTLLEPRLPRLRAMVAFAAGAAVAVAAVGGPWWLAVYRAFGNPLFPFYNAVFASPYFPPVNMFDQRFLPKTALEWLIYPWFWTVDASYRASELPVRDARLLVGMLGALLLLGGALAMRVRGGLERAGALVWCAAFAIVGYAFWLKTFSILRYAAPLEMLSGVLALGALALATAGLAPRWTWPRLAVASGLAAVLIATLVLPRWQRDLDPGDRLVDVDFPHVPPDSTVFLLGPWEQGFLAPFQPKTVRFIGLNNNLVQYGSTIGLVDLIERTVAGLTGPLWTVTGPGPLPNDAQRSLARFGLRRTDECRPVTASIAPPMALCRAERLPRS